MSIKNRRLWGNYMKFYAWIFGNKIKPNSEVFPQNIKRYGGKWISVEDNQPSKWGTYFVKTNHLKRSILAEWRDEWIVYNTFYPCKEVTHWKPIEYPET